MILAHHFDHIIPSDFLTAVKQHSVLVVVMNSYLPVQINRKNDKDNIKRKMLLEA